MRFNVVKAIFRRDIVGYFSSPTGYVFITVFILLSAAAAFWQDRFFADNLANLNTLNRFFPILLLFLVPAITMSSWADERRQGVDELLLTLPARDVELVAGKYLAALGIYTVALIFSLSHVVVLAWLGRPDVGLMVANYFAYWLFGAALLAIGMVGSILTDNLTVGFILGAALCAVPVFIDRAGALFGGAFGRGLEAVGAVPAFEELTSGVVSLWAVLYFVSIAVTMLFVNLFLISRRRWSVPYFGGHVAARAVALAVAAGSVVVLMARAPVRADFTAERLHSLSKQTKELVGKIDKDNPVYIQAYISREVPRAYVETRANLVALLREYAALGGERIRLRVVETEQYSDAATEAEERFNIRPETLTTERGGRTEIVTVFLGAAITCGADEVVIPFFHKGLPIEYELTRSIRVVSRAKRLKAGIMDTDAKMFGGIDFQTFQQSPEWPLVAELKKQYEVVRVAPDMPIPDDLNVLVVGMASSLTQPQMDNLAVWIKKGRPTLIFDDPFPASIPNGAPGDPKGGGRNPMMGGGAPPEQKGRISDLMSIAGFRWETEDVVWDKYNPHPRFSTLPPEYVFVGTGNGASEPFNSQELATSGLQEVILIFPGTISSRGLPGVNFVPLLQTGKNSGRLAMEQLLLKDMFGTRLDPNRRHKPEHIEKVIAARSTGTVNVIMIADIDFVSSDFFRIRLEGDENLEFDNITFALNCVDQLVGDESMIELRKRRRKHRTLDAVEERTREHTKRQLEDERLAGEQADEELKKAQARFDEKVKEVEVRTDIDELTKRTKLEQISQDETRKLEVEKRKIETRKKAALEKSHARTKQEIDTIQNWIRVLGAALPPIPALALGIFVAVMRLRRERGAAAGDRWMKKS